MHKNIVAVSHRYGLWTVFDGRRSRKPRLAVALGRENANGIVALAAHEAAAGRA